MLGASFSVYLSEVVLTKNRNPVETEEGMASASSNGASWSQVLTKSVQIKSRPCLGSSTAWFKKEGEILIVWFMWEVGNTDPY